MVFVYIFHLVPPFKMWCIPLLASCGHARKHRSPHRPTNSPKPQFPPRPPISTEPRNPQKNCPLFGPNFPAELRIKIYEAVLGDSDQFMHIVPFDDQSNRVGRRRCDNTNGYELPTFQHSCFGAVLTPNKLSHYQEFEFWSCDRLLALLLTCHRMWVCIPFW
jgi:hypothetical protein